MGNDRDTRGQYDGSGAREADPAELARGVDRGLAFVDGALTAIGDLVNAATSARDRRAAPRRSGAGYSSYSRGREVAPQFQTPQQQAAADAHAAPTAPPVVAGSPWRTSAEMIDAETGRKFWSVSNGAGDKVECNSSQLAERVAALLNANTVPSSARASGSAQAYPSRGSYR